MREENEYKLDQEITENGKTQSQLITYTMKGLHVFISEGANLALQRLLVKKGLPLSFETSALDIDNVPCMMSYVSVIKLVLLRETDFSG